MVRLTGAAMAFFLVSAYWSTPCLAQRRVKRPSRGQTTKFQHGRALGKPRNTSNNKKGKGKGNDDDIPMEVCNTDCKNTIPDFVKNILNLGYNKETELFSGFGYCTDFDFDKNFEKLCCSASALRATIGFTWNEFITVDARKFPPCRHANPFIPDTDKKPNWLEAIYDLVYDYRRALKPGSPSSPIGLLTALGEAESDVLDLVTQDMPALVAAMEEVFEDETTRRRLGIPDAALTRSSRKLNNDDDGVVCLFSAVVAWIVEFVLDDEPMTRDGLAGGVGDAIRQIGCDISGLLTSKCEDWAPAINSDDVDFESPRAYPLLIEGYVGGELAFFVCKLIKELIAILALFIFSPWLLPACHCHYRTEVGCNVSSCYETCPERRCSLMPKQDLMDDVLVAWKQYFPGDGIGSFTALLRACNEVPGDRSYFLHRPPEGEVGGRLEALLGVGGSPNIPLRIEILSEDEQDFLEEVGRCFDLADANEANEAYSYEDAAAYYAFLYHEFEPPQAVIDGLIAIDTDLQLESIGIAGNLPLIKDCLFVMLGKLHNPLTMIAISFFFAQGGKPEDIDKRLPGILIGILGDELLSGLSELELGRGLFPVRRGGEPIDKCLGYCYMHGAKCKDRRSRRGRDEPEQKVANKGRGD